MSKQHILTKEIITPIGQMLAAAVEEGILFLEFAENLTLGFDLKKAAHEIRGTFGRSGTPDEKHSGGHTSDGLGHLEQLDAELKEYFSGNRREFTVPVVLTGTDFQKKAWKALMEIPYGTVWSYSRQAQRLGNPKAVRAVGSANAKNRIAVVVPCHRVTAKNGSLGGYAGGIWRKEYLLKLEGVIP